MKTCSDPKRASEPHALPDVEVNFRFKHAVPYFAPCYQRSFTVAAGSVGVQVPSSNGMLRLRLNNGRELDVYRADVELVNGTAELAQADAQSGME